MWSDEILSSNDDANMSWFLNENSWWICHLLKFNCVSSIIIYDYGRCHYSVIVVTLLLDWIRLETVCHTGKILWELPVSMANEGRTWFMIYGYVWQKIGQKLKTGDNQLDAYQLCDTLWCPLITTDTKKINLVVAEIQNYFTQLELNLLPYHGT